jgi:hypothetical protein
VNGTLADVIGMIGSAMCIVAYAYSNVTQRLNYTIFNLLNLVGALLLVISLTVHFNLASMVLEVVWAGIALFGLARIWLGRSAGR